jgi:DNA polymerase bacteriophage-type
MIYSIDFETRSRISLPDHGLDIYANDDTTEVLCIAFGTTPDNVVVDQPKPPLNIGHTLDFHELLLHVKNGGKIQAWNAMFEYAIWNCVCAPKYGWPELKLEQCIDSMAIAAANNVPQSLDDAGDFLATDYKKDGIGKKLIQKLCKPTIKGDFLEDPKLMAQLFEYCAQDVRTEMSIVANLRPLTAVEQDIWTLTQRINLRGVPVDPKELQNAVLACEKAQGAIDRETLDLTGCKPSERAKLLGWLNAQGADMADLTAKTVTAKLVDTNLRPDVRRALELRQEGSQTSVAKYAKMLEIQRKGVIRNTLIYHGASTGRFASRGGLNLQNIARPDIRFTDEDLEEIAERVFERGESATMTELSSVVRNAITAPRGKTFVDIDFSSVENRVGVWLADQKDKVEMFRKGLDEYKVFASESLYRVPYDQVTKDMRQVSKSAVLGSLFGQGPKGLVRYAEGMGVTLSEGQAKNAVDSYRLSYSRVKALWALCENAAIQAVENPGNPFSAGSKLVLKVAKNALWMQLPSKRLICWQAPQLALNPVPWGGTKLGVTVHSMNTFSRQWGRNILIGSSIFQSAVQGCARDFLTEGLSRLDEAGYEVINLIHDEYLLLADEDSAEQTLADALKLVTQPPKWALDMPLAGEGWISKRYRK